MKKIYSTLVVALFSATLAFGQAPYLEYDLKVVLATPASQSEVVVPADKKLPVTVQFQNAGTTTIPTGDTLWYSYGKVGATTFYGVDGNGNAVLNYANGSMLPAPGLAPSQAVSLSSTFALDLTPFAEGDQIEIIFWGLNGEGSDQENKDDRKDIDPANNSDWFKIKAFTVELPACDIKGAEKVCKDQTIPLEGIPAGGTWSQDDNSIGEVSQTGVVTGKKAGTVKISYSGSTCTGTKEHSVVVDDNCPASSIEEFDNATFNAYPNPAVNELNIQSLENIESVNVLSLDGKVISTTYGTKIDVSNLKSGVYLYKVTTTKGEVAISKFVKE